MSVFGEASFWAGAFFGAGVSIIVMVLIVLAESIGRYNKMIERSEHEEERRRKIHR